MIHRPRENTVKKAGGTRCRPQGTDSNLLLCSKIGINLILAFLFLPQTQASRPSSQSHAHLAMSWAHILQSKSHPVSRVRVHRPRLQSRWRVRPEPCLAEACFCAASVSSLTSGALLTAARLKLHSSRCPRAEGPLTVKACPLRLGFRAPR